MKIQWEVRPHENRKGEKMAGRQLQVLGVDIIKLNIFTVNIEMAQSNTSTPLLK